MWRVDVSEVLIYRLWSLAGAVVLAALGVLFCAARNNCIRKIEALMRNRFVGLFVGWAALIWCVPHAQVVAPAFLLPFLIPLAIVVPVLSFFCLDHMTARAVGGVLIIVAYEVLHRSFDLNLDFAPALAVACWLIGGAGIWISGIPFHLRDALRLAAEKRSWKFFFCSLLFVFTILFTVAGVWKI